MSRTARVLDLVPRTVLAALLAVSTVGCQKSVPAPKDNALPPAKLQMLNEGDRLINEGEDLKDQAKKRTASGQDGAELDKQGDAKIAEGKSIKQKAMQMKE